jgi:excisionase family DNA binding protein
MERAKLIVTEAETPGAAPTGSLSQVLTVDELAQLLRIDRKVAYEAIAAGQIPGVRRIGRRVLRISRDAVLSWLHEGKGDVSRRRSG